MRRQFIHFVNKSKKQKKNPVNIYTLIYTTMSSFYTVVQIFLIVSIINIAAWLYAPRNQTLRAKKSITVFRSTFILTTSMMFLMWAITYLSQLHPLVEPRRSDLRVEQKI